jgi:hypothetical protein
MWTIFTEIQSLAYKMDLTWSILIRTYLNIPENEINKEIKNLTSPEITILSYSFSTLK